ncbi:MAG TPA: substrate-binding domain-containing protein [Ktedonobacteraceae bacterium]|jgi:phosphate transport system substrate-binding protein
MVKRDVRYLLYIVSLTILFVSCGEQNTNGTQSTVHENISIEGSTALEPFISNIATTFEKQTLQVTAKVKGGGSNIQSVVSMQVQGGGSVTGLDAITQQKADIGMTDIYADPATYSSPDLTPEIVIVIPYTLVVNPGLTFIQSLTTQQILGIFSTHTIKNWKDIGGPDLPVVPISMSTVGTPTNFQTTILGGNLEAGTPVAENASPNLLDTIAHTPGAIGYAATPLLTGSVRAIAIDGLTATPDNIESNRYHFWSYGHLYTLKNSDSNITSFFNYALTPAAQQVAQSLGYIPLASMKTLT